MTARTDDREAAPAGRTVLESAPQLRARLSRQVDGLWVSRPAAAAPPAARSAWLRTKADVHDQIAARLREFGDVAGAIEAEVLASRARIDARDLAREAPSRKFPASTTASIAAAAPSHAAAHTRSADADAGHDLTA